MDGQRVEKTPGKGKIGLIVAAVLAVLLVGGYLGLCAWVGTSSQIMPGVSVAGVSLGGMTREQAGEVLAEELANSSGQLPPYVLKPVSYDDVQTVVRRVRTGQPVVLVFRNTNIETAKRILDFSFGLSFGIGGEVSELGDRVFAVLPAGIELTRADIDKLVADGDLVR